MPTPGRNALVLVNEFDITTYLNDSSATEDLEADESTTYGTDAKTYEAGLADGSLSASGLYDGTADAIDEVLRGVAQAATNPVVTRSYARTRGTGASFGEAVRMSHEVSQTPDGLVETSVEFQMDEGLGFGRILTAGLESLSATGDLASVDFVNDPQGASGGFATLHIPTNAHTGTVDVVVEDSPDAAAWATVAAFTQVPASTATAELIRWTGATDRYMRVSVTAAGTGSFDLLVAAVARA